MGAEAAAVARTDNPYLEEFGRLFPNGPSYERAEEFGLGRLRQLRQELCTRYAWAVPTEAVLSAIGQHGPIAEMGAGTGYWAHLLRSRGVEVEAFDTFPKDDPRWDKPKLGTHEILKSYPSHSLLLCWPPFRSSMAADCLNAFSGQMLIYVGEAEGGCTADDDFFGIVREEFSLRKKIEILNWPNIHDAVWLYQRSSD